MFSTSFTLKYGPESLRAGSISEEERMKRAMPMAGGFAPHFFEEETLEKLSKELRARVEDEAVIGRLFAYLVLLGQNLEIALRECLLTAELYFKFNSIKSPFKMKVRKKALFNVRIAMFKELLDLSDPGSQNFVKRLDHAKSLRNDYVHNFYDLESPNFAELGSRRKLIHRMKNAEKVFFPLIMVIQDIENAYADDIGLTEFRDKFVAEVEREREERRKQTQEILDEIDSEFET